MLTDAAQRRLQMLPYGDHRCCLTVITDAALFTWRCCPIYSTNTNYGALIYTCIFNIYVLLLVSSCKYLCSKYVPFVTGKRNTLLIHSLVIHIFAVWEEIGEKILFMCASDREGGEHLTERDQRWKSQRIKIHRIFYRFLNPCPWVWFSFSENFKIWQKSWFFWFEDFFSCYF